MLGDHHLWRKTYAYEGSARIPLIIKPPAQDGRPVKTVSRAVAIQDIMPTILDMLGLAIPATVDGISMKGLLQGKPANTREFVHGEHSTCYSEEQEMQYITDGRFKYIWFPLLGTEQFFDLRTDLSESADLADHPEWQEEVAVWRRLLVEVLEQRNLGLTDGGKLVSQAGKPFIISPHYQTRLESSSFDWHRWESR